MLSVFDTDEVTGPQRAGWAVLRRLAPLFGPHRRTLALATVLLSATTAAQLAGPLLIRRAIDVDILGRDLGGLIATVGAYVTVQIAFLFLNYVQRVRLETMGQEIILGLRRRLFSHLIGQSLAFFDRNPVGRLISRVQGDTDAMRQMFASTVVTVVETLVLLVGIAAVMIAVSPRLTLVVGALVPFIVIVIWVLAAKGSRWFRKVRERAADVSAFVAERVQGVPLLQAFGREEAAHAELTRLDRSKFSAALRAEWFGVSLFQSIFLFEVLGLVLVLWFGGRWALAGEVTIGTVVMFFEYLRRLFEPLVRLSEQLDVIQRAAAGAGRVLALLDLEPEVKDDARPRAWDRFEREIEFQNVWFSYTGNGDWALKDVSFRIPRGQTWAIVGATGGGKTSILSLLLRFYEPQKGTIRVDGIETRTIAQRDLRRRMALVLQDVYLFPGDVLGNIAPDGVASGDGREERLKYAARVVGAGTFIERLPGGYRTALAERGANLSAGERQLLSFARALAADPEILLLDEATALVDPRTELEVQRALKALLAGRTAIVIAHRLSTIRDADGILVVKAGRIVEQGRHEELLAKGGVYADLHALQFQPEGGAAGGGR